MRSLISLGLAILLVLGGGGARAASPAPVGSVPASPVLGASPQEPVFVDSADIRYLDGFPVPVQLDVLGSLPTPCHVPAWEVAATPAGIDVHVWSVAEGSGLCSAVLEPFEASIPLGSFEAVSLPVRLNGTDVGRVEVSDGANPTGDRLVGAGWSFGMCQGYCAADLVVADDGSVILRGRDQARDVVLFTNPGTLTGTGLAHIEEAMAALAGVPLQLVYGCPDCADGGAAYLTLSREGAVVRHEMEFGDPPIELSELEHLAMSVIDGLEDCASNELVDVATECQAWVDPA
jgi:hypothetical protein